MDEIISYLKTKKNLINLLTLAIIVLGLPLFIGALRQQQIITSSAKELEMKFLTKDDVSANLKDKTCVVSKNNTLVTTCEKVVLSITAPTTLTAKAPGLINEVYAYPADPNSTNNDYLPDSSCVTTHSDCIQTEDTYAECSSFDGWYYDVHRMNCSQGWNGSTEIWCMDNQRYCPGKCGTDSDCSGGTACRPAACNPNYAGEGCGFFNMPNGTSCGDNQKCDGEGNCVSSDGGGGSTSDKCYACDTGWWRLGGCAENPKECKNGDSSTYDGCKGGDATGVTAPGQKACTGSGGGGGGSDCIAAVSADNGGSWLTEIKSGVNRGDSLMVSARNKTKTQAISDATLKMTDPDGKTSPVDWKTSPYFKFEKGGKYTLTADGGACSSKPTATVEVGGSGSGGGGDICFSCQSGKWRTGGCAASPKQCKSDDSSTFDGCKGGDAQVDKACGSGGGGGSATITGFRLAENYDTWTGDWLTYSDGVMKDFAFKDKTPGKKFVFVEFKDSNGKEYESTLFKAAIDMLGGEPTINGSIACPYDIKNDVINITIPGSNFGSTKGTLSINDQTLSNDSIDDWKDNSVKVHIRNPQSSSTGTKLNIKLTKGDGQFAENSCTINVNQFDVGAKWMCGVANTRDIVDTTLSIYDMANYEVIGIGNTNMSQNLGVGATAYSGSIKTKETVIISKDGTIKNTKTKLKEGSLYKICVKPPLGLRTCSGAFTFSPGTVVTKLDIPIGDLNSDGCINSADAAILRSQWGVGPNKLADFLQKGSVNCFDWACMLQNFGKCDTPEPF